jgi:hypothetical protein
MAHALKDIKSVVKLVETCHSRIVRSQDSSLTNIQRQQSQARLRQSLSDGGITYRIRTRDVDGAEDKLTCSFASLYIRDSGVITDVKPFGHHPIGLSSDDNVSVAFEPRDLTQIDRHRSDVLSNARFASLNEGSSFVFSGRLVFCDYYFDRPDGSFFFWVDSEFRPPMSFADWVRKLWSGKLPGIDFVR